MLLSIQPVKTTYFLAYFIFLYWIKLNLKKPIDKLYCAQYNLYYQNSNDTKSFL